MSEKKGLDLLRAPFPKHQISKLPKPTKAQTDEVKADYKKGIRCQICKQWHHPDVVHLDYVGHAAITDRLLDADPNWSWEPLAYTPQGLPVFDDKGGLWIKLTVCGVTRLGYGSAESSTFKEVGAREKEVIGDALRNAAMRFGAALDLWHKGELHLDGPGSKAKTTPAKPVEPAQPERPELNEEEVPPADPKTWVIQNGMWKGKRFSEIPRSELSKWVNHWEKLGTSGTMKDDVLMAKNYLGLGL